MATGAVLAATLGGATAATSTAPHGWPRAAAGINASDITTGQTLRLVSREDRFRVIDVGRRGESPGDYVVFEETLLNTSGAVIGRDSARCMGEVRTFRCDGTFLIYGKGKIEVSGSFFPRDEATIAVTGGTGRYQNVRGQARITGGTAHTTNFTFSLIP